MTTQLKNLTAGQKARVTGFSKNEADRAYRHKLLAMGLTPGVEFEVTRIAPLGDPVEITLRGFAMSLRKAEADVLEVTPVAT
jgi:ferrous iron transport protein A